MPVAVTRGPEGRRVATCGLIAVALFIGALTVHAADFASGVKAYNRGDYATALGIFRQLADQGGASAQFNLGLMYQQGQGVTQDYAEGVRGYHVWHRWEQELLRTETVSVFEGFEGSIGDFWG